MFWTKGQSAGYAVFNSLLNISLSSKFKVASSKFEGTLSFNFELATLNFELCPGSTCLRAAPDATYPTMSVLLIFVDGLGIGTRGPHNPLHLLGEEAAPLAVFEDEEPRVVFDGVLARTDARLGVEGRPQSASGQTTILTGVNAPALLGKHKQGFPNERLREVLREHSLFLQLKQLGVGPLAFANAYSPRFFAARPRWVSATTVAVEAAGLPFRTDEDIREGRAVYHDFTNSFLVAGGAAV